MSYMDKKKVICRHCGREMLVSLRAFSTCCPGCNQRLGVGDQTFTGPVTVNRIETCGSVVVAPKGHLHAHLRVKNLQVQGGRCQGDVVADEKVTIASGARLEGDITANRLEVSSGARLKGFLRIGPGTA